MKLNTIAATFLMLGSVAAFAQTTPAPGSAPAPNAQQRIDKREANQANRIEQGKASGELTNREAARLQKGQEHVQKVEDKAKADGTVTKKEAARVEKAQDRQNRHIAREKHDRQHDRNHDGKMDRPAKKQ